jgi:hypothetical protein
LTRRYLVSFSVAISAFPGSFTGGFFNGQSPQSSPEHGSLLTVTRIHDEAAAG